MRSCQCRCGLMQHRLNGDQRGNLVSGLVAAKVHADSLWGAQFCRWWARWLRARFAAEIKRLSSLGSVKSGLFGVCRSFEEVLKIAWCEKRSEIERGVWPAVRPTQHTISRSQTLLQQKRKRCNTFIVLLQIIPISPTERSHMHRKEDWGCWKQTWFSVHLFYFLN